MLNHYTTLGVASDAEPEVIKAAYRALIRKYHPDMNVDPDATARSAAIGQAYAALSDPQRRADYDEKLRARSRRKSAYPLVVAPDPVADEPDAWDEPDYEDVKPSASRKLTGPALFCAASLILFVVEFKHQLHPLPNGNSSFTAPDAAVAMKPETAARNDGQAKLDYQPQLSDEATARQVLDAVSQSSIEEPQAPS